MRNRLLTKRSVIIFGSAQRETIRNRLWKVNYLMNTKRYAAVFSLAAVFIALLLWINLSFGSAEISVPELFRILSGGGDEMNRNIIWNIRLPRAVSAVWLGGGLALSGYLLQTFFGNPIVGPFVLGISSSAKLVVALTMIWTLSRGVAVGSVVLIV